MKYFVFKEEQIIYQHIKWEDNMKQENYEKIISLLDQIIAYNYTEDLKREKKSDAGQSFNLFHLQLLRDLITDGKE